MRQRFGSITIGTALLAAALAPPAEGFDGRRSGFGIELGAGVGFVPAEEHYVDNTFQLREAFRSKPAGVTRLRMGWGFGEHVLVQLLDDVWWTTADFDRYEDRLLVTQNAGLGLTYFFRADERSVLAEVGLGAAMARAPAADADENDRGNGPAIWIGAGYAFSPWIARLTFGFDGAAEEFVYFGTEPEHDTLELGVTLSRAWF